MSYSLDQMKKALYKAHAAGDTNAAQMIAGRIKAQTKDVSAETMQQERIEKLSPLEAFGISVGSTIDNFVRGVGSAVGLAEPKGEFEQELMRKTSEAHPVASFAGDIAGGGIIGAGTAALAAPALVGAGPGALVGAAAGIGGLESAAMTKGAGGSGKEVALSGALGAGLAGGMQSLGPKISKIITDKLKKFERAGESVFESNGQFKAEFVSTLNEKGLTPDDLVGDAVREAIEGGQLKGDEIAGLASLQAIGIDNPTLAQVVRTADNSMAQQEFAKKSGIVRQVLEEQDAKIHGMFDAKMMPKTQPIEGRVGFRDAVVGKASRIVDEISDLYSQGKELAGESGKTVELSKVFKNLDEAMYRDKVAGGNISAMRGDLLRSGAIDKDGNALRSFSLDEVEEIRKGFNTLYNEMNPQGNMAIREAMQAFDENVLKQVDEDLFFKARKAHSKFKKDLELDKLDRFDKSKKNVLQEILDGRINEDNFAQELMTKKSTTARNLKYAIDYIKDESPEAIESLKDDTVELMREKLFSGGLNENMQQGATYASYQRMMKAIPPEKLRLLFDKEQMNYLKQLGEGLKRRTPVGGAGAQSTFVGEGVSAVAMNRLRNNLNDRMENMAIVGNFYGMIRDALGAQAEKKEARRLLNPTPKTKKFKKSIEKKSRPGVKAASAITGSISATGSE